LAKNRIHFEITLAMTPRRQRLSDGCPMSLTRCTLRSEQTKGPSAPHGDKDRHTFVNTQLRIHLALPGFGAGAAALNLR
jgi:hypothetical protein